MSDLSKVALALGLREDEKLHVVLQNIATLQGRLSNSSRRQWWDEDGMPLEIKRCMLKSAISFCTMSEELTLSREQGEEIHECLGDILAEWDPMDDEDEPCLF